MKKLLPCLLLIAISFTGLKAQQRSVCINDTLRLTTGLDHMTGNLDTIGGLDANWTVISGPGASQLSFPAPATVLDQYSGWHYTLPNSHWISPFTFPNYSQNNVDTPYVFRYAFCLGQQTIINLFMEALDDDLIAVYLDGTYIDSTTVGYNFVIGNQDTFTTTRTLAAGNHYLDVNLYNFGGVALGLDVQGYITSLYGLVTDTCCNTGGSCSGSAYRDRNGDGERDKGTTGSPVDDGLPGWQMELTDGTNSWHKTTDKHGDYSFVNIAPGTYTLNTSSPAGSPYATNTIVIGKQNALRKDVAISNSAATAVKDIDAEMAYFKAYPNPATSLFQMDYYMTESADVSLHIENAQGQTVMQVMKDITKEPGTHHQTINVSQLPAGVYFYSLTTDRQYNGRFVKK
ncbi:MAG: Alpha-L-arabinofuranosidase-like protein [Bacteroidetes bacterium]|nr:Alpha-L-arabinofuranosidase-like protein [Bacteroidota bacterium]